MSPTPTRTRLAAAILGLSLVAAACGSDDDDSSADVPAAVADGDAASDAADAGDDGASSAAVDLATSDLGEILVGESGLTLYGFTDDVDGSPTCNGACADAWPPVIVDADADIAGLLGSGLDGSVFSTAIRDDGSTQLVAGVWPLYFFAGDAAPGETNGQGSGDVWFVVAADGALVGAGGADTDAEDAAPVDAPAEEAVVSSADSSLGTILVDGDGLSLYGFTNDSADQSVCNGACADAWPPVIVAGSDVPDGLDPAVFAVIERDDGSFQLRAGNWPLYRFAGDAAPGDVAGQGSGDVWFVVAPDGSLISDEAAAADLGY